MFGYPRRAWLLLPGAIALAAGRCGDAPGELAGITPTVVLRDSLGRADTVGYNLLLPRLLDEVQRLERQRKVHEASIRAIEQRLNTEERR
jgi:hypothetical protein